MAFQLFGQRDPQWSGQILLGGPDTIGAAGCLLCVNAMIVYDSYGDSHYTPGTLNALFKSRHDYVSGDLLTDQALSAIWPDRFTEVRINGYNAATMMAAVNSPNQYCYLGLSGPGTHFVLAAGSNLIADPWTGKYGTLSGYLNTGWHVTDMVIVTKHALTPVPAPAPAPVPAPAPKPLPAPTPPIPMEPDRSLQGILVALINLLPPSWRKAAIAIFEAIG